MVLVCVKLTKVIGTIAFFPLVSFAISIYQASRLERSVSYMFYLQDMEYWYTKQNKVYLLFTIDLLGEKQLKKGKSLMSRWVLTLAI